MRHGKQSFKVNRASRERASGVKRPLCVARAPIARMVNTCAIEESETKNAAFALGSIMARFERLFLLSGGMLFFLFA